MNKPTPKTGVLVGITNPTVAAKGWVAVAGAIITTLITLLSTNGVVFPESWQLYIPAVLTVLTSVAVYFVPNAEPPVGAHRVAD